VKTVKSRIRTAEKILAGYELRSSSLETLKKLCSERKIQLKVFGKESAGIKVGKLVGFSGFNEEERSENTAPDDECLIISGFSGKEMDHLLGDLKKYGVEIALKCVVTAYNQGWTLCSLIEELKKEHEAMNKKS
jgi:hypothetical protein